MKLNKINFKMKIVIKLTISIVVIIFNLSKMSGQNDMNDKIQIIVNKAVSQIDWAGILKYQDQNKDLILKDSISPNIVFMGDSITEGWSEYFPDFFLSNNYLNRGISGQTTSQMLLRFRQDVIDLKPKGVVILAGINDIAKNTRYYGIELIAENIFSMAELAKVNNITPIICSVLPADKFTWNPKVYPAELVKKLNILLESYAKEKGIKFLDYYAYMNNNKGGMINNLTNDGVHVTPEGYEIMIKLVKQAINDLKFKI